MGDSDTVFCSGYVPSLGMEPVYASLSRYVSDVGGWDNSRWIVFHGAAADPDSPWHDNQAAAWAAGKWCRCCTAGMRYWVGAGACYGCSPCRRQHIHVRVVAVPAIYWVSRNAAIMAQRGSSSAASGMLLVVGELQCGARK